MINEFNRECDNIRKEIAVSLRNGTESHEVMSAKLDILSRLMEARLADLNSKLLS
jgi:hypothetical protein